MPRKYYKNIHDNNSEIKKNVATPLTLNSVKLCKIQKVKKNVYRLRQSIIIYPLENSYVQSCKKRFVVFV